jgi:VCBS repeat-containing protein
VTDPAIVEPVVTEPEVIETPDLPETIPVVDVIEIPSSDQSASSLSLKGSDPSPTPTALASALLDIDLDIVPKPPVIPAFAPLMGIINGLASWVDKIFPPYDASPILNPTQVAGGWVMTLMAGLQGTYWQGQPTPFTFGALVLVTAAYARYERLATNHLPGMPEVSAGPLPLTWKLKSIDPDGDLLVYSVDLSGQPSNGLITMSPDGTFSFIPTSLADLNDGTDVTFTVRVNDSLGMLEHPINPEGNDAFYTVSFRYPGLGINNLPVFTPPGKATVVGTDGNSGKVTISAQATDADGDPLTYTATSLWGTVTRNEDGTFTYTPSAAARHAAAGDLAAALGLNKDLVSIWANDGRGGITLLPTTVTVDIVGANNAPTVTVKPPAISDPLTGLIVGGFEIDDDDHDLVTFSPLALTTSRGGIVTVTGLGYTYLPSIQARSQGGTDTFTVTADDGHGGTVEVSITVTIAKFNIGPVGGITVATPDSDGVVRGQVAATDLNGDTITFKLTGGVSQGYSEKGGIVLLNANGTFTFIPKPSADALPGLTMDSFEVELSDGNGGFATTTVTVFADLKLDPKVTSNAGGVITGGVDIDDNDNAGLLTYSVGTGPNKGTVTVNADGTYTYTATTAGWNETDSFTIIGTVNGLSITVATVSLIPKPNVAPTSDLVGGAIIPVGVGSGIATGNVNAQDGNGDTLHYSVTGYGGGSTITLSNGSIVTVDANGKWTYIPGLNSGDLGGLSPIITGSSFTVYITDGKGGQTSTPVIVTTHELDLPVTKVVNNGTVTGGLGLAAGEQGLMTYSVGTGPNKGTITVNPDGTYTYTATSAGWNESDTFTIQGTIGGQTITVATVSVVPKSNAAPSSPLLDGATVIGGSGIATGNIGASDANGDTLHYSVTGYGGSSTKVLANGSIVTVDANGKWSYIPGLNSGVLGVIALSSFTVYVSDGKGGETSTLVTVNTHDLDIAVTKTGSNGTVTGGLALATDDQGLMTYKVGTGPSKGTVTVNADGTYTYNATTAGWNQTDSFTIVGVVNGVEITVANVSVVPKSNAAPTSPLTDGATILGGSGIATGNIGASDANGDTLHYSVTGYGGSSTKVLSNGSIVTVDANGKWSYVPGLNSGDLGGLVPSIALSSFTVYISDGKGGETSTTVIVNTHELDIPVTKVVSNGNVTGGLGLSAGEQGILTYKVGAGPTRGTVTVNLDGTYTYNATTAGWNQADSFTIVGMVDGVEITVANVSFVPKPNQLPTTNGSGIALGDSIGIAKGNVGATDGDGDALTYSVTGFGGAATSVRNNGSIVTVDANGNWAYVPKPNSGILINDTITIYVQDSRGGTTTHDINITTAQLHGIDYVSTGTAGQGRINGIPSGDTSLFSFSKGAGGTGNVGAVTVSSAGVFTYTGALNQAVSFDIVATVGGQSFVIQTVNLTPPTISTSIMSKINTIGGGQDEVQWNGITISGDNATLQKVSQLNGVATIGGPTLGLWSVLYNSNNGSWISKGSPGNVVIRAVNDYGFFSNSVTLNY